MPVFWLIKAQDALQNSLGAANLQAGAYEARIQDLSLPLEATFPESDAVLVVECLQGYSTNPGKQVFRIESVCQGVTQARIVKVGNSENLSQELRGWEECRRPTGDRGRIFMRLSPGKPSPDGQGCESLVYEDAQQTLRAVELNTLELA